MLSGEVNKRYGISRHTLIKYRRKGIIHPKLLPSGYYDYDEAEIAMLKPSLRSNQVALGYYKIKDKSEKFKFRNNVDLLKEVINKPIDLIVFKSKDKIWGGATAFESWEKLFMRLGIIIKIEKGEKDGKNFR